MKRATPESAEPPNASIDHRVILASAGTGKTYQLTNRLIGLLASGVSPAEIVATTFTRKAAGEIMERVVERLCQAATTDSERAALAHAIGISLSQERCVELLASIAASLDRFSVMTIDSFFQRIASVLSLEIGAGPERRIADEAEDEVLREEALATALEAADRTQIAALVRLIYDGKPNSGVLLRLRQAISCGLTLLRATRHEPNLWGPEPLVPALVAEDLVSDRSLQRLGQAIQIAEIPLNKDNSIPKAWVDFRAKSASSLIEGRIDDFVKDAGVYVRARSYSKKEFPNATLALYQQALDLAVLSLRDRLRKRTRAARSILDRFEREYELLKARRSVWRFEDVPRAVLEHIGASGMEHAYFRLDGRVQHLLLDEFQDTSMDAFRLLEPLIGEIVANEAPQRSLFCVGDVKQSLYAWNGAEPELLPAIADRWPQVARSSLAVSRRSSPVVLNAVNRVFDDLAANIGLAGNSNVAIRWARGWVTHEAHDADLPGEFNLLVPDTTGSDADEPAPLSIGADNDEPAPDIATIASPEVSLAVERVARHRAAAPDASIAILVRSNKSIAPLIHALTDAGIESSEEGAGSLLDAAPCAVIRSLFHLADHPGDTAARFHVAHSPLGPALGLSTDASDRRTSQVASSIRADVERDGLAHTVQRVVESTSQSMSAREHARATSLIHLARRLDAEGRSTATDLTRAIDASRVRDPASTPVRVMTTHASKGLEFDVVILTDLGTAMYRSSADIIGDRPEALGPITHVTCRPPPSLIQVDPQLALVMERARDRVLMEGLCILYVAMTRARHALDVIVTGRSIAAPRKDSSTIYPGRLVAGALVPDRLPILGAGVQHQESMGDWPAHVRARAASGPSHQPPPIRVHLGVRHATDRPTGRLSRVSPSSLEGGDSRTLGDVLRPASNAGRSRGTVLHALYERVAWLEDGTPTDEQLIAIARDIGSTADQARDAIVAFRASLDNDELSRWLRRTAFPLAPSHTLDLWRERAFATRVLSDGEPVLLSGRFDRVVVRRDASGAAVDATLLDFKTDSVPDANVLASRVEHYTPQVRAYRDAIVSSTGLPRHAVRCILMFTEAGRAIESAV